MTRVLPRRRIGRTSLEVTVLGFGGAPLGDLYTVLDDGEAIATVEVAAAQGVTLFDTSPLYGHGLSEHRVGTALRRVGDPVVVSTKVGRVLHPARGPSWDREGYVGGLPFEAVIDYSYDGALRSLEQSLQRLGRARIDIALIHDVDVRNHGTEGVERRFTEAMNGAYRALHELRADGLVSAIGVGVNEADMCARFAAAGDFDCMLLAGRYSLLEQGALDTFLPTAQAKNISVLLGGVFNSGILATGAVPGAMYDYAPAPPMILERVGRIEAICKANGVPLPAAAMQFAAAHPAITSLVMGAVTPAQVRQQRDWLTSPMPDALWSDLVGEGLVRPDAPRPSRGATP